MSEQVQRFTFEFVGPRAGKTVKLGGGPRGQAKYSFVNGKYTVMGTTTGIAHLKRILGLSFNAHLPGSPEHAAAVEAWKCNPGNPDCVKQEAPNHGNSSVQASSAPGKANAVPGNVQSTGSGLVRQRQQSSRQIMTPTVRISPPRLRPKVRSAFAPSPAVVV